MTGREVNHENLPPENMRLLRPNERIETILDNRGLVDLRATVEAVKATVRPEYNFVAASGFPDDHHLQWPRKWYAADSSGGGVIAEFDDLAISKARLPRVFHNWLHHVTVPPPIPSLEVMQYRVEAQRVALSLLSTVRNSKRRARAQKRQNMSEVLINDNLIQFVEEFVYKVEQAAEIPPEFQLVPLEEFRAVETADDMFRAGNALGRFAVPSVIGRVLLPDNKYGTIAA